MEILVRELGSRSEIAKALKFLIARSQDWLNEKYRHPSNSSMNQVLDLAGKVNLKGTREILDDESNAFDEEIATFVRRGANR